MNVHRERGLRGARFAASTSAQPACVCLSSPERLPPGRFHGPVFFDKSGTSHFPKTGSGRQATARSGFSAARRQRTEARRVRADNAFRRSSRQMLMHNLRQLAHPARRTSLPAWSVALKMSDGVAGAGPFWEAPVNCKCEWQVWMTFSDRRGVPCSGIRENSDSPLAARRAAAPPRAPGSVNVFTKLSKNNLG